MHWGWYLSVDVTRCPNGNCTQTCLGKHPHSASVWLYGWDKLCCPGANSKPMRPGQFVVLVIKQRASGRSCQTQQPPCHRAAALAWPQHLLHAIDKQFFLLSSLRPSCIQTSNVVEDPIASCTYVAPTKHQQLPGQIY